MEKPSIQEVLAYAKPIVAKFIGQFAADAPFEQKEEMQQNAALRVIEAYPQLDANAGWKSFVYNHSRGAVLDYLKFGKGFAEERWSIAKEEEHGSRNVSKMRTRESYTSADNSDIDLEQVLGANGVYMQPGQERSEIRWDLLARLASSDESLLAFLKWLRGFSIDEIGVILGLSRARSGQLVMSVVEKLKSTPGEKEMAMRQVIWALGLADRFGIPDMDQSLIYGFSIGWNRPAVDLDSWEPKYCDSESQMDFFG
jgi:RNA polymerase sigma factor (sigma-70 family)